MKHQRKNNPEMLRDECEHGSLRRSCRICELEGELARAQEALKHQGELRMMTQCPICGEGLLTGGQCPRGHDVNPPAPPAYTDLVGNAMNVQVIPPWLEILEVLKRIANALETISHK